MIAAAFVAGLAWFDRVPALSYAVGAFLVCGVVLLVVSALLADDVRRHGRRSRIHDDPTTGRLPSSGRR